MVVVVMAQVAVRRGSKKHEALKKAVEIFRNNPRGTWGDLVNILVRSGVSLPYAEKIVKELAALGIARREGQYYVIDVEMLEKSLKNIERA
mgnify:CR=1 FL=1|jgi:hypothetical protein